MVGEKRVGNRVEALDDANGMISDLAHWIRAADSDAAVGMAQGFGAALERAAALRASGRSGDTVAIPLAEQATVLSEAKDIRHVGWLLLSLNLELLKLQDQQSSRDVPAEDLLREVHALTSELVRKGVTAVSGREAT